MGSIADEMKKVIQQWDAQDEPQQEIKMETKQKNTITSVLLNYIKGSPGITSIEIKKRLAVEHPTIPMSFVSSMLKQFTDNFSVSRTHSPVKVDGRSIYAYTAMPEEERKKLRTLAKVKRNKAKARAEHARAMKEQKKSAKELQGGTFVPYETTSISDALNDYEHAPAKTTEWNTKPAEWTVDTVLDNLTVKQARAVHIALKEMFGG